MSKKSDLAAIDAVYELIRSGKKKFICTSFDCLPHEHYDLKNRFSNVFSPRYGNSESDSYWMFPCGERARRLTAIGLFRAMVEAGDA